MPAETTHTLVIGGGQSGLAMSAHLTAQGTPHIVLERHRIAERWRSERWDSLVANGPAWHDRFPILEFTDIPPDSFPTRDRVVRYFEEIATQTATPIRTGVTVTALTQTPQGFLAETSHGPITAKNVVAATGPFQRPLIPTLVPAATGITQLHSSAYRNPSQLPPGAVLVVGAGSSGSQIADELARSGRRTFLSVGPHDRPPRTYRGHDYCWWLGVLGIWDARAREPGMEHVTISVSGAYGGHTVEFRTLAAAGITLLGRVGDYDNGTLAIASDLAQNIHQGDAYYLAILRKADAYAEAHGLNLPPEPEAHVIAPDPDCVTNPLASLNLADNGIAAIIWATGFTVDYDWLKLDTFDPKGRPLHDKGISPIPGLYFLGLPWLTRRASPFIWGVWHDAAHLAAHIAQR